MTGDDRLRTELESLERAAPAALPPRPAEPRPFGWLRILTPVASVVLAATLLAVVVTDWLDGVRPTGTPPASGSAAVTATPLPSLRPPDLAWHVVPFDEPGAVLISIAEVDGRVFLTGSLDAHPQAWVSDDGGATWLRSPWIGNHDWVVDEPGTLGTLAGTRERLVSVGTRPVGGNDAMVVSTVWVSDDFGVTWSSIPEADVPPGITDLVWNGSRFLAFGGRGGPTTINGVPASIAVWSSADGNAWEQVSGTEAFGTSARLVAVAEAGAITAVALAVGDQPPELWLSPDGARWAQAEDAGIQVRPEAMGATDEEFVISNVDDPGTGQRELMRTVDGQIWDAQGLELPYPGEIRYADVWSLTSGQSGLLITGYTPQVRGGAGVLAWFLPAGADQPSLLEVHTQDAAAIGDSFIGISSCQPLADCMTALVMGLPAGVMPPQPTISKSPVGDGPSWTVDCGTADSTLCEWVLEAVFAKYLNPGDEPVASIALGEGICLDGSCPYLSEVENAIGVTVVYEERPFPLHVNCYVREGEPVPVCIAAARTLVGEPEIGIPYAVTIFTHCGLRAVEFDGDRWAIDGPVESDLGGNPPDGFGNPQDHGTVTLVLRDEGIYLSEGGVERRISRGGALPPVEGCI